MAGNKVKVIATVYHPNREAGEMFEVPAELVDVLKRRGFIETVAQVEARAHALQAEKIARETKAVVPTEVKKRTRKR